MTQGRVVRVAGPVVAVAGLFGARLGDVVRVGEQGVAGEIIRLHTEVSIVQVYEDTTGLRAGDPATATGSPLTVELGPGLVGRLFDGVQRPLEAIASAAGAFVGRSASVPALDRAALWDFQPRVEPGADVAEGDVLGVVCETTCLEHRVLVPPGTRGVVTSVRAGRFVVEEPIAVVAGRSVSMLSTWPVRTPRPVAERIDATVPLITGQRVVDTLFPVALGGTATVPGGFGTGKTVLELSLARFAEADVIVYVGCGERGNELAEAIEAFSSATDPRTGAPLLARTIVVANTSNMPVAAREASIYTGVTMAEYFRDQGYDVALMADSTSRWAEALREVSGRLEEMPAEEGYPAYLPARLAGFYERAGAVRCLGADARNGSLTIVGAVSPPGGDLTEPVTQHTLRTTGVFWALDTELARARHFPAVDWTRSYTLYDLDAWFTAHVHGRWAQDRAWALALLQQEAELLEVARLLGPDVLAPAERGILVTGQLLRDAFLQQSAFDPVDARCPPAKQHSMLATIRHAHDRLGEAVAGGASPEEVAALPAFADLTRMRWWADDEADGRAASLRDRLDSPAAPR